MHRQEILCEDIEGRGLQVLTVHTCSDCGHSIAVILDDGIPFPLCDDCRTSIHQWMVESTEAHNMQMEYERDKYFEDKYDGMKCED